ncbi:DUF192 domain-containing protein [Candidatus Woesearchaeota archaeon]|nr:DUF192 domain-containing protein [Candidatus Woesearchaeota archaeon]
MMIINKTKNSILSEKAELCKSPFSKALGLMFSGKSRTLVFIFSKEKIISLHMFFVFYPIDVLFLDKNKKVVETKIGFRPFTFCTPKNKAMYVIELPSGTVKKTKTSRGDIISFK